jgi:hypothetical protein
MGINIRHISAIALAVLFSAACGNKSSSGPGKEIKSTKSGNLTITIASASGEIKNGENDLTLSFTDQSGNTVDVGAASLSFQMPAMGSMPEMNDKATLTTTAAPGVYNARVNIEMAGTWEARVRYQGANGTGEARMTVNAK